MQGLCRFILFPVLLIISSGCGYSSANLLRLKADNASFTGYGVQVTGELVDAVVTREMAASCRRPHSLSVILDYDNFKTKSEAKAE